MVAACMEGRTPGARLHVAAMHALAPEPAARLLAAVRERIRPATELLGAFGPVMVAHTRGRTCSASPGGWEDAQPADQGEIHPTSGTP
ncbi:MAG: hypothetical protein KatS3mg014_1077 [Actinomycetota bacterium]|nr:MAG: hypothetical protein KatS3mg014_1077 [Actinomycetota bacterium]